MIYPGEGEVALYPVQFVRRHLRPDTCIPTVASPDICVPSNFCLNAEGKYKLLLYECS